MRDLEKITKWAYQWKMKFNPDITKQAIEVIFSCKYAKTKPVHPPLFFNDIPVARQASTKHIGLTLDERLSFTEHIKEAIEKAKKGLALMKFLANKVPSKILELTYTMYVRPHLDYGDVIYHDQLSDMMKLIEQIQYKAALICTGCWKGTCRQKLYDELGWESLEDESLGDLRFTIKLMRTVLLPTFAIMFYLKMYHLTQPKGTKTHSSRFANLILA